MSGIGSSSRDHVLWENNDSIQSSLAANPDQDHKSRLGF